MSEPVCTPQRDHEMIVELLGQRDALLEALERILQVHAEMGNLDQYTIATIESLVAQCRGESPTS